MVRVQLEWDNRAVADLDTRRHSREFHLEGSGPAFANVHLPYSLWLDGR